MSDGAPNKGTKQWFMVAQAPESDVVDIEISGVIGYDWEKEWRDEPQNEVSRIKEELAQIKALDAKKIRLKMTNSPGGLIHEGIAIYDELMMNGAEIETFVVGYVASIASTILQAGKSGKRIMSANADMLVHKARFQGIWDTVTADNLEAYAKDLRIQDDKIKNIFEKSGVVMDDYDDLVNMNGGEGVWISAQEALDLGFIDEIVEPLESEAVAHASKEDFEALEKMGLPLPPKASKYMKPTAQAAATITEEKEPEQEGEPEMDKETLVEALSETNSTLAAEITSAIVAALKPEPEAKEAKEPEEPAKEEAVVPEIKFEGDADNPEDVQAHLDALNRAKLHASVDWSDPESVASYQKVAFADKEAPKAKAKGSNLPVEDTTTRGHEKPEASADVKGAANELSNLSRHKGRK